ncbi:phage tail tape measure protein, TP901 family, core region [Micromonospora nigra]|uniref:Phage tail tape measure protein, TP901 family, core region n=1 Tax=Micromonospora nigra TaxID=145857 RepID=A0A1C6SRE4_9ACTN|nr:phage tail tape measure protein [Micromonospora nigra]SCL31932.1 phage tail tape measure protein, TP901 family, core region [Micromonospora nigra]
MDKDLSYRLSADPRQFEKGFKSAEASARALERELVRLEAEQARVEAAMDEVGTTFLAAGAAIGAGLVIATRAAISWESAWTGVAKVIDGSPEQLAELEGELRQLARTLPQTHEEIAGVAAAAGQLGIARQDIVDFTRVMVDLGVATNLTSEEAAFALARLMNIMQTAPDDVDRLGATIVELGNNSATTEQEIVDMSLRIAGAGKTVRMSEADVLGYAAALSSVGVMAEAGGSAISRAFIIIEESVRSGGDRLETFAQLAGMSAEQYAQAYREDAAGATAAFIQGLGRMQAAGGDVFKTLADLGMSEILLRDALLRLAGAGDLVTRSLSIANRGWDENTALLEEAERRYATVESRMQIARNQLNDFAIDIGNVFLPAVGEAADLVGNLGGLLADLPGPVQAVLAILAATAATLLLVGGAALLAVPQIAAYKGAIDTLAASQGRLAATAVAANSALGRVGSFLAGPWGLAIGGAIVLLTSFALTQAEARGRARELTDTLDEQSGAVTRDTALWVANELTKRGVIDQARELGISAADLTQAVLGEADAVARVNAKLDEHKVTGSLVSDLMNDQTKSATSVREAMRELGGDLDNARELHDQLAESMQGQVKTVDDLDPATRQLATSLGLTAGAAEDLTAGVDELDKALKAALDTMFGLEEAEDAAVRAMRRMTEAAKENGGSLKGNSEAALTNRDNVRSLIKAHTEQIVEYAKTGATTDELATKTKQLRDQFVRQATQAGLTKSEVRDYAKAYDDVPSQAATHIKTPGLSGATSQIRTYVDWLRQIPREVRTRLITEQQTARGGRREFNALGGPVGNRYAGGGEIVGPHGYDAVPLWGTRGEWVSTVEATRRNRAALEAANAGARLAVVGSSAAAGGAGGGRGGVTVESMTVQAWTDRFSLRQVEQELAMHGAV